MPDDLRLRDAGAFPKVILLDTTNFCNLRCSMCGHRLMTRPKGKMSMGLYRKLIDEIADKDKDARVWLVFFGEALIFKEMLCRQIQYAKSKGLTDVVLNSNGVLLDRMSSIDLIASGLDAIYVGIDAFDEATYNKLRVGGNYNKVVTNVNQLIELERGLGLSHLKIFVQFVEMAENTHQVEAFTEYWTRQGATVKIRPKVTWAGIVPAWNAKDTNRHPCYWAMRTFNVCWDGRVVLCSVDCDAGFVAGDVSKDTIESVWMGPLRKLRLMHQMEHYQNLPEICRKCTDWQMAKAEYHD